jgi:site-specific DNA-methyltransferase (adenine-specific)
VTSPPYFGLRDYGVDGQIGLEPTPEEFVAELVAVFREVRRVLRDDGTLWLNLGDGYGKGKQLLGVPWRVALALQGDGWLLRQDIIWHKPNAMPESVKDRCVKAHEYVFLLAKTDRYYFDYSAVKEALAPGSDVVYRNALRKGKTYDQKDAYVKNFPASFDSDQRRRRSVWSVNTRPYTGAHCAPYPPELIEPCILAGCPPGGVVLDPFGGSGTTAGVAQALGRSAILCELNPEYAKLVPERVASIRAYYAKKCKGVA